MSRDKLPGFAFLSQNAAFLQWYLSKRCVLQWCLSGASVVPQQCASPSFSQMSRDKLPDFAFLSQKHDGHDGSKMPTCTTLCHPVSLKCPDKLSDFAFLYQTHDGHDGSKMSTCTTLCRPVSLKCPEISSLTLRFCLKTLCFLQWYLSKRCVLQWCLSGASVVPQQCASSSFSQMSRDKLPDFAFLYQKHDEHDGSKMSTCTTICHPDSLKCPEISSLTMRFCTKHMMDMMAQRCLLVQLSVVQFLSNVPR